MVKAKPYPKGKAIKNLLSIKKERYPKMLQKY